MYRDPIEQEIEATKSIGTWKACWYSLLFAEKNVTFQFKKVSDDSHKCPVILYQEGQPKINIFVPLAQNEIQDFIKRGAVDSEEKAIQISMSLFN